MENKKKFTIKDLAQGRCAVINDGSVEELKEVLSRAFPDDCNFEDYVFEWDSSKYYCRSVNNKDKWARASFTDLPAQSILDFLVDNNQAFEYEYKWYDVREVLPDERFDGKMVAVKLKDPQSRIYGYRWDNEAEGFYYLNRSNLSEYVLYWCPLPDFPQ